MSKQSGIILIDKPEGISSAKVVSRVKRALGVKKVGHTGTLDPFATGLMICGINSGTRISRFFLKGSKTYVAELKLGMETDTLDSTGAIISENSNIPDSNQLITDTVLSFEGPQMQTPPSYSALKHNGVPLYKLARKGISVEKPPRPISIHSIEVIDIDLPFIRFSVSCSSGTYIRVLGADIGKKLGCGGHLTALRRTETCGFSVENSVCLDQVAPIAGKHDTPGFISLSDALPFMPEYLADDRIIDIVKDGKPLVNETGLSDSLTGDSEFIKIVNDNNRLIAIVTKSEADNKFDYCCVFHDT